MLASVPKWLERAKAIDKFDGLRLVYGGTKCALGNKGP